LKKIIFYSYLKCSTCRKAAKWLKSKDFEFQLIDIVKEPPLVNYLNLALKQYSDDKKRIFNTRGKAFKTLNLDINGLTKEEIIQLLLSDGKLIKRPFITFGFISFLFLIPLASTSTNNMIKRLGFKLWKKIHYLIYPVAILASMHFYVLVRADKTEPVIYMGIIILLLLHRIFKRLTSPQLAQ